MLECTKCHEEVPTSYGGEEVCPGCGKVYNTEFDTVTGLIVIEDDNA